MSYMQNVNDGSLNEKSQNDSIIYYFMRVELPRYNLNEEPVHACLNMVQYCIPSQSNIQLTVTGNQ